MKLILSDKPIILPETGSDVKIVFLITLFSIHLIICHGNMQARCFSYAQ